MSLTNAIIVSKIIGHFRVVHLKTPMYIDDIKSFRTVALQVFCENCCNKMNVCIIKDV